MANTSGLEAVAQAWFRVQVLDAHLLQRVAARYDLNPIDVRLLKFLRAGDDLRTPKQIGAFLSVGTSNVTAILDRLEPRQFIRREANPNDRRSNLIALDARGLDVVEHIQNVYWRVLQEVVDENSAEPILAALRNVADRYAMVDDE